MPDSFVGLVLFVVFLSPGITYFLARELRRPQRELSAFREAAVVVLMGVACNSAVLLVALLVRAIFRPSWLPDPQELLQDPVVYYASHAEALVVFSIAVVLTASIGAFALGYWSPLPRLGTIRFESAWYREFHEPERIYCGCTLEDGSWVGGYLRSFNTDVDDSEDRDLVLTRPRYRPAGTSSVSELQASVVIVSARRIMHLEVGILDEAAEGSATAM